MVLIVCVKQDLKMFEYDLCLIFAWPEKKTTLF